MKLIDQSSDLVLRLIDNLEEAYVLGLVLDLHGRRLVKV